MAANPALKSTARWLARLLLGGVFIYAGGLKSLDPAVFATDIDHYRLLPYPLALLAGLYLPWLEILCGTAVILRWRERGALLLVAGLCALFALAITSAWVRGLDIRCGCFGHGNTGTALPVALLRSLVLGTLAVLLLRHTPPARQG